MMGDSVRNLWCGMAESFSLMILARGLGGFTDCEIQTGEKPKEAKVVVLRAGAATCEAQPSVSRSRSREILRVICLAAHSIQA